MRTFFLWQTHVFNIFTRKLSWKHFQHFPQTGLQFASRCFLHYYTAAGKSCWRRPEYSVSLPAAVLDLRNNNNGTENKSAGAERFHNICSSSPQLFCSSLCLSPTIILTGSKPGLKGCSSTKSLQKTFSTCSVKREEFCFLPVTNSLVPEPKLSK